MITVDLADEECAALRRVLETYLSDLRMEIADTDSFDFRAMLKERKGALQSVLRKLPESRSDS